MRRTGSAFAVAFFLSLAWSVTASSQDLHGTWLRLTVKGNGLVINNSDDTDRRKGVFRGKCYMLIEYDSSSDVYTGRIACEIARNVWAETSGGPTFDRFSDEGGHSRDHVYFTNRNGYAIEGNGTHLLTPTYNNRGLLKNVRLESYGEILSASTLEPGVSYFMGGYQVKGASILERGVPDGVLVALGTAPALPAPSPGVAGEILSLVNGHRAAGATCGSTPYPPAPPLSLDASLNQAAEVHAVDMASNDFFDHQGSDGSSPFDRITAAGYLGFTQGENIAAGYPTPAAAVAGWMSSPGHCQNIMDPVFTFMGGGHAYDAGSTYGNYWVQTFGGN